MLSKMGLLDGTIIEKVVGAYIIIGQYCEDLIVIGGALREDMPKQRIVYLDAKWATFVAEMNRMRVIPIDEALNALETYIR
jgi:hypothetical protein